MDKETKPENSSRLSEGMIVAIISAVASILAALIGGAFMMYSTFATSHSPATPITSQTQNTAVPTLAATLTPSTPILNGKVTPTPILSISTSTSSTPTPTSSTSALSVYPTSVAFSSCLSKDNRTFAFNIRNSSNTPISWTISSSSSYSYSSLEQSNGQLIQGNPITGNTIPAQQTQAVLVSNISGNGVISVSESGQSVPHGINIVCATSPSSSVYPQLITFNSCSSNPGNFVLSIINNSSTKISWQIANQAPSTSGVFSTLDGKGTNGTIAPKQTEVVLVSNITTNTVFFVQDVTHNTPLPISITCN